MRNLNLDQVQTLIAIADLGTFAAAAQALHLAPPTISLHVKELESRMQTHLVARGRRQAELTPAGLALVQEGRKLLAASDDLIDVVRLRAAGGDGLVKVGVSAGVGMQRLPLMLDALRRRNPRVELKLEAVGSAEAMQRLQAATLDVGIVASPQPAVARVALMPWRNDPMVALVPASWKAPETVTPEWLSTRRWASFAPGTQMHGLIAAWFGQAGFNPRPFLTLSYPGALKALATANQSAAILPLDEVEDQQQTPEVLIRPLSPPLMRPMAVAYRSAPTPNEAMTAVLEVLAEFAT
ncbi:CysJI operon transcriptional activator [Achromobacter denitrificans]|nr:CysJI operon transcriptional activator [Achromobacter denitrificans]